MLDFPQRWIDAGLFDPEADGKAERLEVLAWLDEMGIEPDVFAGVAATDLVYSIGERFLRPGQRLDRAAVREASGLGPDQFDLIVRAAGYNPGDLYTEADLEAIRAFGLGSEMFSEAELFYFVRVLSSSMARVADAATSMFRIDVGAELEARGGTELEWAKANYEATQLLDVAFLAIRAFLLRELQLSGNRGDRGRELVSSTENVSTLQVAVAFVDLVGYTPMAEAMSPDELGRFVQVFEAQAHDIVAANNGRLVKLIGDEVMFVTVDPSDACAISRSLIAAFEAESATPRAGIAYGEVIARGGDYYGRVVNMASRIADLAVTGEVLVDDATAAAVGAREFDPAGRRQLKGFAEPVTLHALRTDN